MVKVILHETHYLPILTYGTERKIHTNQIRVGKNTNSCPFSNNEQIFALTMKMDQHPKMQYRVHLLMLISPVRRLCVLLFGSSAMPFLIQIMLQTTEVKCTSASTAYVWLRTTTKYVNNSLGGTLPVHLQKVYNTLHLQV